MTITPRTWSGSPANITFFPESRNQPKASKEVVSSWYFRASVETSGEKRTESYESDSNSATNRLPSLYGSGRSMTALTMV